MNKNILAVAALAATLSLGACDNAKKTTAEAEAEVAEIEAAAAEEIADVKAEATNVAEFVGVYEGTLAQADGAGFVTTVELKADNTFTMTQAANGGEAAAETTNGNYVYTEEGAILTLTDANNTVTNFAFQGDKLVLVGADNALPENPENYTLLKKVI